MADEGQVWITGVGAVSPLGTDFAEISASLLQGKSAIRPVTGFDASEHPCQIAGQLTLPECPAEIDAEAYESAFPLDKCAIWCCWQSLADAGLWVERGNLRIGLVLGVAAEAMSHWDTDARRGGSLIHDLGQSHPSTTSIAWRTLELCGPTMSVAAACASGNHALALARDWIEMGLVDVCLAGACDMGVTPYSLASFGNLRALSRRNETPAEALRPFDCDRDGMVLGEGGAVFVLERSDSAQARGRAPYAELAGVGMTSDAYHLVIPSPEPTYAAAAMRHALASAQVRPEEVDYVNAHATGTPVGDVCEARALHAVFGDFCSQVPVSSTKSMTGHLLGAAAAIEALACLTAITYGAIPPTINLNQPDPACNLRHVANKAEKWDVRIAMSNSFGFGGHNTSLLLKRPNARNRAAA
jgi:3-oxoacyl-[acyl-carrier-protein] synthase II